MRFQPRLLPTLGTLCLLALFVYLGLWQQHKGEHLAAELAERATRGQLAPQRLGAEPVDPLALRDTPIEVRGVFDAQKQFFLDNRQHRDQPGVHVITPLRIEGGQSVILVNRGWIGWGASRAVLPVVAVPSGPVVVTGLANVPSQKEFLLMPKSDLASPLWPRIDLARYAAQSGHSVQPVVLLLQSQSPAEDGAPLVREWPAPPDKVAMHQGYAFQWFCMAFGLVVFYLVASTVRAKR